MLWCTYGLVPKRSENHISGGMGAEDGEVRQTIRSQGAKEAKFGMWQVTGRNGREGGWDQIVNGFGCCAREIGLFLLSSGEPSKVMRQSNIDICFRKITQETVGMRGRLERQKLVDWYDVSCNGLSLCHLIPRIRQRKWGFSHLSEHSNSYFLSIYHVTVWC